MQKQLLMDAMHPSGAVNQPNSPLHSLSAIKIFKGQAIHERRKTL